MTPDDRTRTAVTADDLTRSLPDPNETAVVRPSSLGGTPTGVRVVGGPTPATPATPANLSPASFPADDPPMSAFDQFVPQGEIGRGGMGVVYRALDTTFMRDVAVKVLSARLSGNRTAVRRFLEEARVTGQLTHTAIPPVYHIGALPDGRPYLAMKLIKGRTLGERLKDCSDPMAELPAYLGILEQVCLGVGYAHSRGVIHRDLKPGNVMVGAFGEVQVMDWGLAKEVNGREPTITADAEFDGDPEPGAGADGATKEAPPARTVLRELRAGDEEHTRAGTVLGTPPFMSPEQAAGQMDRMDARSDVFSLGAMLCVVLTGHPPYTAPNTTLAVQQAREWDVAAAFRRLGQCKADPGVVDLCKRCLAKDPAQRPADGEAVATAFAELRAAAAERLRRADLLEMARIAKRQELKRLRGKRLALGGVVLASVALCGAAGWYVLDQKREAAEEVRRKAQEDDARKEAEKREKAEQAAVEAKLRGDKVKVEEGERRQRDKEIRSAVSRVEEILARLRDSRNDAGWASTLEEAKAVLRRAEELLAQEPTSPLSADVASAADRYNKARSDYGLTRQLEDIAEFFLARDPLENPIPTIADGYRNAFRGFQYFVLDPDPFASRVKGHPFPASLIEGVFEWHHHATPDERKRLAVLLDKLTVHDPLLAKCWAAQKDLTPAGTKALLALAGDSDAVARSPWVAYRVFCVLWARGEREAAASLMRRAIMQQPSSYRLHARFALHLAELNTPSTRTEAVAHATAAIALWPGSPNSYLLLARLSAEEANDPAAALPFLERAVSGTRRPALLAERAALYTRLNRFKEAEAEYADINRTSPTVETRLGAVRARWGKGDREGAVREMKLALVPTVPKAANDQLLLARTCRTMYLSAEAEAAYRAAVAAAPKDLGPRVELARFLAGEGGPADGGERVREAERLLTSAAADFPTHYLPRWCLVVVYSQLGQRDKALAAGREAAKLGQGVPDAEYILGRAQLLAGEYADATATAEEFGVNHPNDWRGPALLAEIAAGQGKGKEAVKHYNRATKLNPRNADLWYQWGTLHAGQADPASAVKAFAEAVRLEPDNATYHQNLGGQLTLSGNPDRGFEHLTRAKELNPALKDAPPAK